MEFKKMKNLDKIGLEYGTDKSSDFHDYLNKYEKYINFDRNDKIKILEIGIAEGKSLKMWKDYFINSTILGIDIRTECKNYEEERIFVEIGDQTNEHFLSEISEKYGPFDLIIDDGSHMNYDVITTFNMMFKNLSNKGLYIVEDSCTSYWGFFGGGLLKPDSTMEFFKKIIDEVNFNGQFLNNFYNVEARRDDLHIQQLKDENKISWGSQIESINFLNSLILITKR
jgi:hypothetical protein